MAVKPPLGLSVVMRSPNGAETTWWSGSPRPDDRPQGINWRTERGSGFLDGGCTLNVSDIRTERTDLGSLNEAVIVGDTGDIAYEGSLVRSPRSMDTSGHSISPQFVGPIALAQDRTFTETYCDRQFSSWSDPPLNEKVRQALAGFDLNGAMSFAQDQGLTVAIPSQAFPAAFQRAMAWYSAPEGVTVAKVMYKGAVVTLPVGWAHGIHFSATDSLTAPVTVVPTLDGTLRTATPSPVQGRYVAVGLLSAGTALTPAAGSLARYDLVAAYGNHGLTTRSNGTDPDALYLTDILIDVFNRYCPQIDTSGVQQNTTLIAQAVYKDQFPHDAALDLNKYALWELGVWEDKRLQFEPADLTDYDWEVRLSDPGVTTTLVGDDAVNLRNGILVQFTEAGTGKTRTLSPDDYDELRDDAVENPANAWGRTKWGDPYVLSAPCDENMALAAGISKLAEDNAPKEAGDINVTGHVRDRAGHWQPYWKVRAGETVAITDFPNSRPRRISQTSYSHDGYQATISVDNNLNEVEAFLDFYGAGLQAANLV